MKINYMFYKKLLAIGLVLGMLSSCEKYVDAPIGSNMISKEAAFNSDNSATSATLILYSYNPTVGHLQYATWLGGLSSDELQYTGTTANFIEFAQNVIAPGNTNSLNYLWTYPYQVIRYCNLIIDGVSNSSAISAATKNQLIGEAKFFRALMYFNMVNYFGGVPISSDPIEINNAFKPRATIAEVYSYLIADLKDAQELLPTTYAGTAALKIRANKWAATALLAKAYLYNKDYVNAEAEATKVIGSGMYTKATLANAFINTSSETILQLATLYGASVFTTFRTSSSAATVAPPTYVLNSNFTKDFEINDNRKTSWVDSTTYNSVKYYRLGKYKVQAASASATGNEYTVLLRLGEVYLIRAEARAQQGTNILGAQQDLNEIRNRAGLGNTTASSPADLLTAIAKERKLELFGEYANRWFDLKRTGKADEVLVPLKSTWKTTAQLYPIPEAQILLNYNLIQNLGYN